MNKITVAGRLTKDPVLRESTDGKSVCRFSLALNNGKDAEPTFVECVAFNGTARFASYMKKGDFCVSGGRIVVNKFKDKTGVDRREWNIICDTVEFERHKVEAEAPAKKVEPKQTKQDQIEFQVYENDGEDLPF